MPDVTDETVTAALLADVQWARAGRELVWQTLSTERVRNLIEAAVRAERERIAQLAVRHEATYRPDDPDLPGITGVPGLTKPGPDPLGDPFADLIREPQERSDEKGPDHA